MIGDKRDIIRAAADLEEGKQYELKEYHPKRSLTANSYYHALLSQLAAVLLTTRDELHAELIGRYSVPYVALDGNHITIVSRAPIEALPGYWTLVEKRDDRSGYMRLKGSSEMDSKEFSRLLDGLIDECKECGVETLKPWEVEKLRGYEINHAQR